MIQLHFTRYDSYHGSRLKSTVHRKIAVLKKRKTQRLLYVCRRESTAVSVSGGRRKTICSARGFIIRRRTGFAQ